MRICVIGAAGFVGSSASRMLVGEQATVLAIDKAPRSAVKPVLGKIAACPRFSYRQADFADRFRIGALLQAFGPDAVVHAACGEPGAQGGQEVEGDLLAGTWRLLDAVRGYWAGLPEARRSGFRFVLVVSAPSRQGVTNPIAVALAEVVLSWQKAFGLPVAVLRTAPAFGPLQHPRSMIPSLIAAARDGVIGTADPDDAPRQWIHTSDLSRAILAVLRKGTPGTHYEACGLPLRDPGGLAALIETMVARGRGGNATWPARATAVGYTASGERGSGAGLSTARLEADTGWEPEAPFSRALAETVHWYLANEDWWRPLQAVESGRNPHALLRSA